MSKTPNAKNTTHDRQQRKVKRSLITELDETDVSHPKKNRLSRPETQGRKPTKINSKIKTLKLSKKVKVLTDNTTVKNINSNRSKPDQVTTKAQVTAETRSQNDVIKVVPRIQTCGMKAKIARISQQDIEQLDEIDKQTSVEFVDGERSFEDETADDVHDHDGVELSVAGSDIDDFPETEPGEVSSSSEEDEPETRHSQKVASKVVKIPNRMDTAAEAEDKYAKFRHLRNDPDFRSFLGEMVDDRMKKSSRLTERSEKGKHKLKTNKDMDSDNLLHFSEEDTAQGHETEHVPQFSHDKRISKDTVQSPGLLHNLHKSPSDTTLYSPGLRKASQNDIALIEKISNFVESIRLDSNKAATSRTQTPVGDVRRIEHATTGSSGNRDHHRHELAYPSTSKQGGGDHERGGDRDHVQERQSRERDRELVDPGRITDQLLVQAERFKGKVEAPKGMVNNIIGNTYSDMLMPYDYDKLWSKFVRPEGLAPIDSAILFLRNFDQDDEFFHVTSQIEPNLRSKIEQGEFVELERLLPKDKLPGFRSTSDDLNKQLFQLITQGTNSYIDPLHLKLERLTVSENGIRHSEYLLLFILVRILRGPLRSGNTSM